MAGPKICIIGGGIIGLSTALQLSKIAESASITLIADKILDGTTSYGAGGLWKPYTLGDTPVDSINRWGTSTFNYLLSLFHSEDASEAGICLISANQMWKSKVEDPGWKEVVPSFRYMTDREMAPFTGVGLTHGWNFTTVICEGRLHVTYLLRLLKDQKNVTVLEEKVTSLESLATYDAAVNCSGLGAKALFGDDSMYPVRGQVLRVKAPWVKQYFNCDGKFYIIPNMETVVLGGTLQKDDWDTEPREEDTQHILDGCCSILPSLRKAEVVAKWAGLRPGRKSVRVETEWIDLPGRSSLLPVIHNYGHGGAGLTLFWGCGEEAVELTLKALKSVN